MMFGYSHCNTDEFQHFKVPVFREIYYIVPSEQNTSTYQIVNEYI
jgi:hypothetical protein